jgi:hypothetical protein
VEPDCAMEITFELNGERQTIDVPSRTLLVLVMAA